jgi:CheY-like chemotaxis protein
MKLKVADEKLSPAGSRFKCPKCSTVLLVKKPTPPAQVKKTLDRTKVLVAHSKPEVIESARAILQDEGYKVITSTDGIDVMIKALKEFPFLALVEVSLPKIYGFELCKKLKAREETKDMKFILVPSIFDKSKYRREPASLYGADDYIEDQDIPVMLIEKINKLMVLPEESAEKPRVELKVPFAAPKTPEIKREVGPPAAPVETKPSVGNTDALIEKAKRLSRTIIGDIYLYSSAKVMESIKNGNFSTVFAAELREGQKLYENRVPQEIRNAGNYYKETIEEFISKKKKELS